MTEPTPNYTPDPSFVAMLQAQQAPIVANITSIVGRLTTMAGTAAERKLQAIAAINAEDTDDTGPFSLLALAEFELYAAKAKMDEAKQVADNAIRVYLTAKHQDNTTERDALVTQYKELAGILDGMSRFGVESPVIPSIPKGSGSSSSGTSRVSSKTGEHYYVKDGVPTLWKNGTTLGTLAWYSFKECGTPALTEALRAKGITALGDEWETELTVNGKTATVGHRHVKPVAEAPAE